MAITGGITARSEALLRRVAQSVDPRAAGMRRLIAAMDKATEKLAQEARNGWPVDRNTKGNPTRKKAGQKHSVDLIEVRTVLHPTRIVATVYNTATYGYYIRSVMVGETTAEQRRRHIWRDGVSQDRYEAQRRVGRKRHAFSVLFRRPGRKAGRLLAKNLQSELVDLLRKEL